MLRINGLFFRVQSFDIFKGQFTSIFDELCKVFIFFIFNLLPQFFSDYFQIPLGAIHSSLMSPLLPYRIQVLEILMQITCNLLLKFSHQHIRLSPDIVLFFIRFTLRPGELSSHRSRHWSRHLSLDLRGVPSFALTYQFGYLLPNLLWIKSDAFIFWVIEVNTVLSSIIVIIIGGTRGHKHIFGKFNRLINCIVVFYISFAVSFRYIVTLTQRVY